MPVIHQDVYPAATLEGDIATSTSAAYIENGFYNINSAYVVNSSTATGLSTYQNNNGNPPYNNNPNSNTTGNSEKLYQLNATTNKTGLGTTLKVMAGDQINIFGKSYWFNSGGNYSDKYPLPVSSLLDAFLATPNMATKGLTTAGISTTALTDALGAFTNRNDDGTSTPWAYINWIFFDEQYNYAVLTVSAAMGLLKIITIQPFLLSRLPGTGTFLYIAATRVSTMCSLITCR